MGKGLHKLFKTVAEYISQKLPPLGESGSEVSHFIPEPINFAEDNGKQHITNDPDPEPSSSDSFSREKKRDKTK